jgi:hypothetical protein
MGQEIYCCLFTRMDNRWILSSVCVCFLPVVLRLCFMLLILYAAKYSWSFSLCDKSILSVQIGVAEFVLSAWTVWQELVLVSETVWQNYSKCLDCAARFILCGCNCADEIILLVKLCDKNYSKCLITVPLGLKEIFSYLFYFTMPLTVLTVSTVFTC